MFHFDTNLPLEHFLFFLRKMNNLRFPQSLCMTARWFVEQIEYKFYFQIQPLLFRCFFFSTMLKIFSMIVYFALKHFSRALFTVKHAVITITFHFILFKVILIAVRYTKLLFLIVQYYSSHLTFT